MKRDNVFASDDRIELAHHRFVTSRRANVVTGGEQVTRVHANGKPTRMFRRLQDRGEMLEPVAETTALPRRRLQRDSHAAVRRRREHRVEILRDATQSRVLARAEVGAGMQHDERHAKRVGAADFVRERLDGAWIFDAEIDEVA